jgi:hypothetical protein
MNAKHRKPGDTLVHPDAPQLPHHRFLQTTHIVRGVSMTAICGEGIDGISHTGLWRQGIEASVGVLGRHLCPACRTEAAA